MNRSSIGLGGERSLLVRDSHEDSVGAYLREIGDVPLLSASEEVELAKAIEAGLQARELLSERDLATRECPLFCHLVEAGERAKRRMVESNLRLVVSVARRYASAGMPLADAIAEGNIGLMRAAERFDYRRGFRFSTYATWWIRQAITRAVANQSRVVRLPVHITQMLGAVTDTARRLSQELGREPTAEEIGEELRLEPGAVREILAASQTAISLEVSVGEGESLLGDLIADERSEEFTASPEERGLQERVREALGCLTPRERRVISMRFGIGQERPCTLDEVGSAIGVTRERVRQIEKGALDQLRSGATAEALAVLPE
ncbi:MAG: sigma-70 family RNA polymerase sigma factor [Chloroflexota bacterium]|nr:sigma-70 family RNA polymerase sigma factor [Chloroflexota bacterium]